MSPHAQSPSTTNELIESITTALRAQLGEKLVALVLFGSRARVDTQPDSDWDFLLIAHDLPEKSFERYLFIKELLPKRWRGITSVLAMTPEEFSGNLQPIYLDIAVDGFVLHDSSGFITTRLAALKHLIEQKSLKREQRGVDLIWRWQDVPPMAWSFEWDEVGV
jgi:predicted nucleotidyltransferase